MHRPLVSIIVPNYNGATFLNECIDSVLAQTYEKWELIICDDHSTDESVELILHYSDNRILPPIVFPENKGAAEVRNAAIASAKGEMIAFLDNDDYWAETKLEEQLKFMTVNGYNFTYTDYVQFSEQKSKIVHSKKKVDKKILLRNNYILTSTVIYDARQLGKIYMASIRKRQDWSLFINIIEKSGEAYCLPKALTYYRKHNQSLSANKFNLIKYNYNFYHRVLNYNKITSFFMLCRYMLYYFLKKFLELF